MDWKSSLKLAAGGVALFALGAFTTAVAIGRVPVSVGVWANRGQIEQVVREYLLANPDIIVQMSNRLDAQQQSSEQKARDDALFDIGGVNALLDPKVAYVVGPSDAKVVVAEFFDYRCPHCKASLGAVKKLMDSGVKVRVAFIERPILTPDSHLASLAAVASRKQEGKYLPFHLALMETTGEFYQRAHLRYRQDRRARCRTARKGHGRSRRSPSPSISRPRSPTGSASTARRPS